MSLIITFWTRFWRLSFYPPALFSDEVDAGYQAMVFNRYSTDYFGNKFPVHFRSLSDWRTSLYIYFIALLQKLGVNPTLSVRLPSAIFSLFCFFLLYLISRSIYLPILWSVSPWAIHYSRTGFEVVGMTLVVLLALYFWQQRRYFFSIFFLCLSPYFYITAKLFLPLIFLLFFIFFPQKFNRSRIFFLSLFLLFCLFPLIKDPLLGRSSYRFSYISIFTMPHREQITDQLRYQDILPEHKNEIGVKTPLLSFILHNRYQLVIQKFITNYLSSFSPQFLFLTGDSNLRHGFGGHGLLYFIDFFFLLYGLFLFVTSPRPSSLGRFFIFLFFLAPLPFSLTRDSDSAHATRLFLMILPLLYFISLTLKRHPWMVLFYPFLFLNFWHYYLKHYPQSSASSWNSGVKETLLTALSYHRPVYFSNYYDSFLPFYLFYTQSPLPQFARFDTDYFNGLSVGAYYFGHINFAHLPQNLPPSLFVISLPEINSLPASLHLVNKIPKDYQMAQDFFIYGNL